MSRRIVKTVVEYEDVSICRTASQMEQICCEPTEELECCEISDGSWNGYTAQELLEKYHPNVDSLGRDGKGGLLAIQLQSRNNPCGEKIIEWDLSGGQCCDEVADMEWDYDNSAEILPAGGAATIFIIGSDSRLKTYRTTSDGTWFSNGSKTIKTLENAIDIYSSDSFCGNTSVIVDDGCSSVNEILRSTLGHWVGRCYTYTWGDIRPTAWNQDIMLPIQDNCVYACSYPGGIVVEQLGRVNTYYWDISTWESAEYLPPPAGDNHQSCRMPESTFAAVRTRMQQLGIPVDTHPNAYAPNGPSDLISSACSGSDTCKWECQ